MWCLLLLIHFDNYHNIQDWSQTVPITRRPQEVFLYYQLFIPPVPWKYLLFTDNHDSCRGFRLCWKGVGAHLRCEGLLRSVLGRRSHHLRNDGLSCAALLSTDGSVQPPDVAVDSHGFEFAFEAGVPSIESKRSSDYNRSDADRPVFELLFARSHLCSLYFAFTIKVYFMTPFNYAKCNVWEVSSLISVLWMSIISIISSFWAEEGKAWFIVLLAGWFVVWFLMFQYQAKYFPEDYLVLPREFSSQKKV